MSKDEPTFQDIQKMPRFPIERLQSRLARNLMSSVPLVDDSRYGEPQQPGIEGRQVIVEYSGQAVQYLVPKSHAWTVGIGGL